MFCILTSQSREGMTPHNSADGSGSRKGLRHEHHHEAPIAVVRFRVGDVGRYGFTASVEDRVATPEDEA
jgi:hypothetical protein